VDELVAENTVNTVPPETLQAYLDHGDPAVRISEGVDQAKADFERLAELGIAIDEITQELEDEGVYKFAKSFEGLIDAIETKRKSIVGQLGSLAGDVGAKVRELSEDNAILRVFNNDPTVWTTTPAGKQEVQIRLGWRDLPSRSQALIPALTKFAEDCRTAGFTKALVLGMGGSSLAPETMSLILGTHTDGLEVKIIDSTVPAQVREVEAWVDYGKTLFIVASKSGTTSEPLALYAYFKQGAEQALGADWSSHFVAITDPGSRLVQIGEEQGFRAVFTADPNVGGRYSALTHFVLVPAALMGIDLEKFLGRAQVMAERCSPATPLALNPGALLGMMIGVSAAQGRDKMTLLADDAYAPFGAWLEQLTAESSGKEGRGILPIADEPRMEANAYSNDRLFVYLRMDGDLDEFIADLEAAGQPVIVLQLDDLYDLAAQFYGWEFAIAIACSLLGVNAFDQPDVQDSKDRTKQKLAVFKEKGTLEEPEVIWSQAGVKVYGRVFDGLNACESVQEVIAAFTELAGDGDYIAINAYLPRNQAMQDRLDALRERISAGTARPTTLGFGPRFLHSTGQLHKGGANNGLFLQITQEDADDLAIPGEPLSFGVLARAQALGDLEALIARDRRAIRIHLPADDPLTF
jgi:transaldolase/glucose-6-phosphate isomerase